MVSSARAIAFYLAASTAPSSLAFLPQSQKYHAGALSSIIRHVDFRAVTSTRASARKEHVLTMANSDDATSESDVQQERRSFLHTVALSALSSNAALFGNVNMASASDSTTGAQLMPFNDEEIGFRVSVPLAWERSAQTLPDRRKILFFVDSAGAGGDDGDKSLVFIAYTPVRDDFTSLGSFGTVDQVAQMTILPKGEIAGIEGTESDMLKSESKKTGYFFDYTIKTQGQPKRHFRTIFSLVPGATGGAGSVLVTLTAQTSETRYKELKDTFDEIIASYEFLKK